MDNFATYISIEELYTEEDYLSMIAYEQYCEEEIVNGDI